MKKKKSFLRIIVSMCAVLGWWGFLYPELTLTPDTVKVIATESEVQAVRTAWDFDSNLYQELLNADLSQITFRSKLFTDLKVFWEALQDGDQ